MAKKYLDFKFSEFTTNKNFNFSRKKILKILPGKYLLDDRQNENSHNNQKW